MILAPQYRSAGTVLVTLALPGLCWLAGCGRTSIDLGTADQATGTAASGGSPGVAGSSPGGTVGVGGDDGGAAGTASGVAGAAGTAGSNSRAGSAGSSGRAGGGGEPAVPNCGTLRCDPHAVCDRGGGTPTCVCVPGYVGDGITCEDEDECATGTAECAPEADCINLEGSYDCVCREGYVGDGFECEDIDECAEGTDDCSDLATCTNQPGSYTCTCDPPYLGDGVICGIGCPGHDFGTDTSAFILSGTSAFDSMAPSCGGVPDAPDFTGVFTAELTGEYDFLATGSTSALVLAVFEGECGTTELACTADGSTGVAATLQLPASGTATAVVEGANGRGATFDFRIRMRSCPNLRLAEAPATLQDTTEGHGSFHTTSCGGAWTAPDFTVVFTAPTTDTFTFDTVGSEYDTVLALLDGSCEGNEIDCNDDSYGLQSEVSADLAEGESVTVVVTGYAGAYGPFMLNVT